VTVDVCVNGSDRELTYDPATIEAEAAGDEQFGVGTWKMGSCPDGIRQCPAPPSTDLAALIENSPPGNQIWRIYSIILHREPEIDGLDYWMSQRDFDEASHFDVAYAVYHSDEVRQLELDALSNKEYVAYLYEAAGCRKPEPQGERYWLRILDAGVDRWHVAIWFAEQVEHLRKTNTKFPYLP
jgi:hypothetical protein